MEAVSSPWVHISTVKRVCCESRNMALPTCDVVASACAEACGAPCLNVTNSTGADAPLLEPSLLGCIGLSAFGGFLEVSSTMCLAYPEYRSKMGVVYSACFQKSMMVLNLLFMLVASVS
jgi:hypothetical protein